MENLRIVRLTAENVKKLRAVEIVPAGNVVQITGANGSGKSSVLDAIYYALAGAGAHPSRPVRAGTERAVIKLDLGEITVIRRFTESGGTSLQVEASNGARFPSPQRLLDELLGALTFDPLDFSRMDPRRQLDQLRGLVKLDTDIDALDAANRTDYASRTDHNRQARALRAQAEAIEVDPAAPATLVDLDALLEELQSAGEVNAEIERRRARRNDAERDVQAIRDQANRERNQAGVLRLQIARLQQEAIDLESQAANTDARADRLLAQLATAAPLAAPTDLSGIRARIDQAKVTNTKVASRQRRAELEAQAAAEEAKSQALTDAMEKRTTERSEAIGRASMPVPGLSFGDGEVIYNGIPFAQASSAEQLRVSVAIAMAANPKLRVLRIKDGSLLDENGLRLIAEMAGDRDFQIWIEQVDTSGLVGIVMEDGAVRGAPEPANDESAAGSRAAA